jgi:hypothetical protein
MWNSDSSDSDSEPVKTKAPPSRRPGNQPSSSRSRRPPPVKKPHRKRYNSDSSDESSFDSDGNEKGYKKEKYQKCIIYLLLFRRGATKRGGAQVSYKEASDDGTGSEDLVEVDWSTYEPPETDNSETIEKIIAHRIGKKGGNI